MKPTQIEFGEITFAIPAQTFGIACAISTEQPLPVVTEFTLRMIHVCESMTAEQIQQFFGFSEREVEQVLQTLIDERLVRWDDDRLELTHYARGRFLESSDSIPRFSKIRDWSGEVAFELVGFTPVNPIDGAKRPRLMVEIPCDDAEKTSRSRLWAERSFQENFDRIYRGSRAEIYKISEIEASTRFFLAVPCGFAVTLDGELAVRRSLADDFLADRLELSQAVTTILAHPPEPDNRSLKEFATEFGDKAILARFNSSTCDLHAYLSSESSVNDGKVQPVVGSLHLEKNRKLLEKAIRSLEIVDDDGCVAIWVAPRIPFWGRSRQMRPMITALRKTLDGPSDRENKNADDENLRSSSVKVLLQAVDAEDHHYTKTYGGTLPEVYATSASAFQGKLELFLIPGKFVCAMYHYQLHHPVTLPIGFMSTTPEALSLAEKLMDKLTQRPANVRTLTRGAPEAKTVFGTKHARPRN